MAGKLPVYCFFDISKAIDSLNHKNLLGKLESLGLSSRSLRWFRSYLADRRQRVLINGELSDCRTITHGVSQGSILDPLLSNTYVNSLPNAVKNARVILCMLMTQYAVFRSGSRIFLGGEGVHSSLALLPHQ